MPKNKDERFEKVYTQGKLTVVEIWVDKETGVNYLFHQSGYSGGLTPLLDSDGKIVVTPMNEPVDETVEQIIEENTEEKTEEEKTGEISLNEDQSL